MSCHVKEMRSKEKKWSRVVDFFYFSVYGVWHRVGCFKRTHLKSWTTKTKLISKLINWCALGCEFNTLTPLKSLTGE